MMDCEESGLECEWKILDVENLEDRKKLEKYCMSCRVNKTVFIDNKNRLLKNNSR